MGEFIVTMRNETLGKRVFHSKAEGWKQRLGEASIYDVYEGGYIMHRVENMYDTAGYKVQLVKVNSPEFARLVMEMANG